MIEEIKQDVKQFLDCEKASFEKLKIPSKK